MGRGGRISDTQGSISLFHGLTSWHNRLSGKQVAGALGVEVVYWGSQSCLSLLPSSR